MPNSASAASAARPKIALMLQGGGALGAYQVGAYAALHESSQSLDWVAGISIGAFNASIIAGNEPAARVERLKAFWSRIAWKPPFDAGAGPSGPWGNAPATLEALNFGQPGFFSPWILSFAMRLWSPPTEASFYDTRPMLETLAEHVDFARISQGPNGDDIPRLTLGATNVRTGQFQKFDNTQGPITPAHALASGSLPPGFPATEIDGELYWDGGCVSNTPLDVIADEALSPTVVFVIDLWSAKGDPPTNLNAVTWRAKEIQYASRIPHHIDAVATKVRLRHVLSRVGHDYALAAAPGEAQLVGADRLDLVHMIYHPTQDEVAMSDTEFSLSSFQRRFDAGYGDMQEALARKPWLTDAAPRLGAVVHQVHQQEVRTLDLKLSATPRSRAVDDAEGDPS